MKETQRTGWLGDEDALEEYYYGPICESCGLRGEDCTCDAMDPQEVCVGMLLSKGNVKEVKDVLKAKVDEAMTLALRHLQDFLGVQSGDQACYFIDDDDEQAVKEWLLDYAMSEVRLYTPDNHPLVDDVNSAYSTDGLLGKLKNSHRFASQKLRLS